MADKNLENGDINKTTGTERQGASRQASAPPTLWPQHGGPDAQGAALHDFSTNSNACGPCPHTLAAVQQADATRYPDPAYTALRAQLAAFHGVAPERIVLAASASEFIHRATAWAAQQGARAVALPAHSYGDCAQAAQARGLQVLRPGNAGWSAAGLQWACEPSSPLGSACPVLAAWRSGPAELAEAAKPIEPAELSEHVDAVCAGQVLLPLPLGKSAELSEYVDAVCAGPVLLPLPLGEGGGEGQRPWHPHSAGNPHLSSHPPKASAQRPAPIPALPQRGNEPNHQPQQHQIAVTPSAPPLRIHDCAYMPLRLHTEASARPDSGRAFDLPEPVPTAWQLWTPNKALGLTGVRAAYAIAPAGAGAETAIAALTALAPSWPVGAHGVALLQRWVQPQTQRWLADCLPVLRDWKALQMALCADLGWAVLPGSQANYFCARWPVSDGAAALRQLRSHGIRLRDCTSFGLPGVVRLGVLPPAAQAALRQVGLNLPTS